MNLSKATKEQLYAIAMDETNRMRDRYAAAKELQDRRKENAFRRNRPIDKNGARCT